MEDVRNIWENHSRKRGKKTITTKLDSISSVDCYLGTVLGSGEKMFFLEVSNLVKLKEDYALQFRGLIIQTLSSRNTNPKLATILLDQALEDVFIIFVEDLVLELKAAKNEQEALDVFYSVVSSWRRLFEKINPQGLNLSQQKGLFGELWLIKKLMETSIPASTVLKSWTGPDKANQDFSFASLFIEIKTTAANRPTLKITNEHQLDPPSISPLFLGLIEIQDQPGKMHTLPNLINEVYKLLNGSVERDLLKNKLEKSGYFGAHEEHYSQKEFLLRKSSFFIVDANFPKIIPSDLNNSLFGVSYQIDISGLDSYSVSIESIIDQLK